MGQYIASIRLDGYIRVSTVRGREGPSFISPDVQRQQIDRWATLRDVEIAAWHTDLDRSGTTVQRPGLKEAVGRIKLGHTDGLVVAKLDRFARSITGALETIREITDAGGSFVSVAEGIDPTTPAGKLQQNIMLVFAEFEVDRIRDNWATAKSRAVERGIHIASKVPTGYQRREDGRLEPHPVEAGPVAELFRLRAGSGSWRTLCNHLNANSVQGPYRTRNWTPRAMQHIIENRVYLGEARSGEYVKVDAHEPIIDRATWEAAQVARGISTPQSANPGLLSGLLRCAGCRFCMKPDKMKLHDGSKARIYRCRGDHSTGTCHDRSSTLERVIAPYVEERLIAAIGDLTAVPEGPNELQLAIAALNDAEGELAMFRDNERISTALGEEGFVAGLEGRADAVNEAQAEVVRVRGSATASAALAGVNLKEMWPEFTVEEKQKLMGAIWDCIFLRSGRQLPIEDRVFFIPCGQAPADLPRRGRRNPVVPFVFPDDAP